MAGRERLLPHMCPCDGGRCASEGRNHVGVRADTGCTREFRRRGELNVTVGWYCLQLLLSACAALRKLIIALRSRLIRPMLQFARVFAPQGVRPGLACRLWTTLRVCPLTDRNEGSIRPDGGKSTHQADSLPWSSAAIEAFTPWCVSMSARSRR